MMTDELVYLSVDELTQLYRSGEVSPVDVTRAVLSRIERFNDEVNAFCFVDKEGALKTAKESETRWRQGKPLSPIDGIPTSIKDVVWVKGWRTTYGSRVAGMEAPATEDAPCTARLREAGAVLLGLTTTPETGWKGTTDNPLYGITRNPWDTNRTPGGSSGGAAVAAALGMGNLHIGTDGGGSIRIPAGFTGIFGHKPSFGRVPAFPASPYGTVSHIGPMARTVDDAAAMLNVLSRPDSRDWYALPKSDQDYVPSPSSKIVGLKAAYSPTLGFVDVDPEVAACVEQAVKVLESLGMVIEQRDPGFSIPDDTFNKHWYSGAAFKMKNTSKEEREKLDPGLLEVVEEGERISLMEYLDATQEREELGQRMGGFHEEFDVLLTPTLPIPAFEAGREVPAGSSMKRWPEWTPFTYPFNLTQQPACSIPCGRTKSGLPVGLQIVGRMHDDYTVLRVAKAFEQACPTEMPRIPILK